MSVADKLGTGESFGRARGLSARRAAVAAATGGVPTEGVPDPTKLPVEHISPNPDNPRTEFGDLTELGNSLKDHGQKQAVTVMNRDAYVKANPARESELEDGTTHVVVDGSSRLWAAREVGVPELKVMVDDTQGTTEDELLESALVANVHRQDLEPMDEARALQRLLTIHGTQTKLANRLHRSQGWVSQRLALLGLTPELQESLERKDEPVDLLRAVGKKPPEEQQKALDQLKKQKAAEEAEKAERRRARGKQDTKSNDYYAVIDEDDQSQGTSSSGSTHASPESTGSSAGDEPHDGDSATGENEKQTSREREPDVVTVGMMPWGDYRSVHKTMQHWMTPEDYQSLRKAMIAEGDN
ncbi:ParB/RepB/Spo0J family partition protein [Streptomyces sp. NPDC058268]|uniref:ParB/RepB/Spo0J family partition protein n=1 Tax=Streptomyces sp. NPDC058268 TaxID=3346413 RepID=UPI0036E3C236